jgi:hypothetical protein
MLTMEQTASIASSLNTRLEAAVGVLAGAFGDSPLARYCFADQPENRGRAVRAYALKYAKIRAAAFARWSSCRLAVVLVQRAPEAIMSAYRTVRWRGDDRDRAALVEALVWPRFVVVRDVLGEDPPQVVCWPLSPSVARSGHSRPSTAGKSRRME